MADTSKPLIVLGCTPVYGHLMPVRVVAKLLVEHGYDVTFVSSSHYQKALEEVGCSYVAIEGYGDYYEGEIATRWPERFTLPPGPVQLAFDIEHCFVRVIPSQHAAMQKAIKGLQEKYPGRPIIQIGEAVFQGALPIQKGANGVKPTATMGIGVIPMSLGSVDTAPFGPGLLPPRTPEESAQYQAAAAQVDAVFFTKVNQAYQEMYAEVGCPKPVEGKFMDAPYLFPDRFLQMCIPSAEYPRSDAPSSIRFTGGLPKGHREQMTDPPTWWDEVVVNKEKKDIVFVCQGTVAMEYTDLTIPLMEALKDRPNTLLVVALGKKGLALPEDIVVPDNTRIADFIPYDELLPHANVFVTNGGYGAFQHGIANGTPIIAAGAGEDKPEVSARAEWSGMGINLRTGQPNAKQLRKAVDEIISDPKYKKRAEEMEAEMKTFDPLGIVIKNIEELTAAFAGK